MGLIILFVIIFIFSTFMSIKFKKDIGQSTLLIFLSLILYVYLLGLFGMLKYSLISLEVLSFLFFIYDIYLIRKEKISIKEIYFQPSMIYIGFVFIFALFLLRNSYVSSWDEYSHWALYSKNVFLFDSLWNNDFTSAPNGYPPIVSCLQYLMLKIDNVFREVTLYRGMFLFSSLSLLSAIKNISFNKKGYLLGILFLILAIPTVFFENYFYSLYVDALLGILFVSLIVNLFTSKVNWWSIIINALIGSIMMLTKEFGILFVGVYYLILLIDVLFFRRKDYLEFFKAQKKILKKVLLAFVTFLPLIAKVSWLLYLSLANLVTQAATLISTTPSYAIDVRNNFVSTIFQSSITTVSGFFSKSPFVWMIAVVLFCVIINHFVDKKEDKKYMKLVIITIIISFVTYCLGLLYSYIYLFGEYEGVRLASFGRYILTILLAIFSIAILMEIWLYNSGRIKNQLVNKITIGILCLFIGFQPILNVVIKETTETGQKSIEAAENNYRDFYELYNYLEETTNIYYISQGTDGFDYWAFRYYLTPNKIQLLNWSINVEEDPNNVWVETVTLEEFEKELSNYSYLYIRNKDDKFINSYSKLFNNTEEITDKTLYKVKENDGNLKLEKIKTFS